MPLNTAIGVIEWPDSGATKEPDEAASPLHSITSSARASAEQRRRCSAAFSDSS
jgi:hypothetical protein